MQNTDVRTYRIIVSYDGTRYGGWQVQPNCQTIQGCLEKALSTAYRTEIKVIGSGRTDAGVHAKAQVAHFRVPFSVDCYLFLAKMNGLLPENIRVHAIEEVSSSFHARFSAKGKIYHYVINTGCTHSPFLRPYSWHIREPLSVDTLKKACAYFVGTHDFKAFANSSHEGSAAHNSVRTIHRLDVVEQEQGFRLEFEGNGFLYKMVRNITGTVIEAARGKRTLESIPQIMLSKDRKQCGRVAPAKGLFLMKVHYPNTFMC